MIRTYRTCDGDMLDRIALEKCGSLAAIVPIMEANPWLSRQPPVLPSGLTITLPEFKPSDEQGAALWD